MMTEIKENMSDVLRMNYDAQVSDIMEDLKSDRMHSANARILKLAKEEADGWDHNYVDTFKYVRG